MTDIHNMDDIRVLVDRFYDKVNQNELLGPVFNEVVKIQWDKHLPIMYNFWGSILLGEARYNGQPFPKHLALPIGKSHFGAWLSLFIETVNEHFEGPKAEEAKQRAEAIAMVFQARMGLLTES